MSNSGRKRWAAALAAAAVLAVGGKAALHFTGRGARPDVGPWRVLADDGGAISRFACVVNTDGRAAVRNVALAAAIVKALPERMRVSILASNIEAFAVAAALDPQRVDFLELPKDLELTIWPQDPFLVLARGGGEVLLLGSKEFERADDGLVAEALAAHLGCDYRVSELSFEGGNIVAGARHVFIGADTIERNAERLAIAPAEVIESFRRELGRPVVVLGSCPQSVDHIDMVVTAVDAGNVVVADGRWGAALAGAQLREDPMAVASFERACQDNYFGDPRIRERRDSAGWPVRPPRVMGRTAAAVADSAEVADDLDQLAAQLRRLGYRVHRVPFLFRRHLETADAPASASETQPRTTQAADEPPGRVSFPRPGYPWLTYNNVLIEKRAGRRTVYLPRYGWEAMDRAASKAWTDTGLHVVPVDGLITSAMYGGSLRCCVKVLRRD